MFFLNGSGTLWIMISMYRAVWPLRCEWESFAAISVCKIRVYIYARLTTTGLTVPEVRSFDLTALSALRYELTSIPISPK